MTSEISCRDTGRCHAVVTWYLGIPALCRSSSIRSIQCFRGLPHYLRPLGYLIGVIALLLGHQFTTCPVHFTRIFRILYSVTQLYHDYSFSMLWLVILCHLCIGPCFWLSSARNFVSCNILSIHLLRRSCHLHISHKKTIHLDSS